MSNLAQDLRFGIRMLAKSPGFTLAAILTLALGIGANTVIFSLINATLLKPLPYRDPARLVLLLSNQKQMDLEKVSSTETDYAEWRKQNTVFTNVGAIREASLNLTGQGEPERLSAGFVTASCFETVGTAPAFGRAFTLDDETPGRDQVVILGHALWQRRYASDPSIVGQKVLLNGKPFEVIGVMPKGFQFNERAEIWVPFKPKDNDAEHRGQHNLTVVARLKSGFSIVQAQTEMDGIAKRVEKAYPENTGWTVTVASMHEQAVADSKPMLVTLLGAVAFVLLIACANVANLLLARFNVRRREVAIRAALGAGRGRLIRQFLIESLLLAAAGGLAALIPAVWGLDLVSRFAVRRELLDLDAVHIDTTVLLFTFGVSLITGLLFGLAPALQTSRTRLNEALRQGGRGASTGGGRLRALLVMGEVTLSLVLLIGAGLMIRTFISVSTLKPGFNADRVMTFRVALPAGKYQSDTAQANFFSALVDRVSASGAVQSAAVTSALPLTGQDHGNGLFFNDRPDPDRANIPIAFRREITPEYFRAMEIPLLGGRAFTAADNENSQKVVIVNQRTARQFWPRGDALGKQIRFGGDRKNPSFTVVGIVGDVRHLGLTEPARYEVYLPWRQSSASDMFLVARTTARPETVTPHVRAALAELDRDLPLFNVRTMDSYLADGRSDQRLAMILFGAFSAIALLLAAIGIYGVMAYSVAQRTPEIGIRMALGAQRSDVLRLVIRQGLGVVAVGVAFGLVLSWALTRLVSGLLFGVSPTDPLVFLTVVGVLCATAFMANYFPARRASRVDPLVALRYE